MSTNSQIGPSIVHTIPISVVNYNTPISDALYKTMQENVLSTGECAPSIFDFMVFGLKCGPTEARNFFVVDIADKDTVPVRCDNMAHKDSLDGTLNNLPDDAIQEHVANDLGYYLDNYIDNLTR